MAAIGAALPLFFAICALSCSGTQRSETPSSFIPSPPEMTIYPLAPAPTWSDILVRSQTLAGMLANHGVSRADVGLITSLLSTKVDLRRCLPGTAIRVYEDSLGSTQKLVYVEQHRMVVADLAQVPPKVYEVPQVPVRRLAHLHGTVQDNLYSSMRAVGASARLILAFADIFAWEVDFLTEIRRGDEFYVVYEEAMGNGDEPEPGVVLAALYVGERGERTAIRYVPLDAKPAYFDLHGESLVRAFLRSPLSFTRISSRFSFSRMHPILRVSRPHLGVDYAAPTGTPVVSVADGRVIFAGWKRGFGRTVSIRHAGSCETQYAHLSRLGKGIRRGTRVSQGQLMGFVGSTGLSTGPHLDFRFKKAGRWVNPLTVESPREAPLREAELPDFAPVASMYAAVMHDYPHRWVEAALGVR